MKFLTSAVTDIGTSRATNQDSISIITARTPIGMVVMAVLCDGMGGMQKGEIASAAVVNGFGKWFQEEFPVMCKEFHITAVEKRWEELIWELNMKIREYGQKRGETLGTTVTAALFTEVSGYVIAHVGDTRCYCLDTGIYQMTKDDSLVQREIDLGKITEEDAKKDTRKNKLLQCVGAKEQLVPQILSGMTGANTTYLLCSDGFWHLLDKREIYEHLKPGVFKNKEQIAEEIKLLIKTVKNRSERDNISAILIETYE